MQIQINTDKNVASSERLVKFYTTELKTELSRFDDKITRVEVHFGDENSDKFGLKDKRCLIEVRIAKKQPVAVTSHAESIEKSFHAALDKVKKVLDTSLEKMHQN